MLKDQNIIVYKSLRIINGKPKWVITDGYGNIIDDSPTREHIKTAVIDHSKPPKKCCKCGTDKSFPNFYNHRCDKDNCTGKLCINCRRYEYYHKIESNIIRLDAQIRNNILTRNVSLSKSIIDQAVVAEYFGLEDLNIKMNNFNYYIDLRHEIYGNIDVKGGTLLSGRKLSYSDYWCFSTNRKIEPDTYFCIGYDKLRDNIIKALIIPNDNWVINLDNLYVYKNPSRTSKYNYAQFEIECTKLNKIYQDLDIDKLFEKISAILKETSNSLNEKV